MHKHRGTISLVHKPRKHYVRHKKVTSEGPRRSQLLGELGGSHTDNILPDRRRATTSILPSKRVSCTLWRLHPRPVFCEGYLGYKLEVTDADSTERYCIHSSRLHGPLLLLAAAVITN